jgi:aspartate kinase
MGMNARSWQGWQVPIRPTTHGAARIARTSTASVAESAGQGQVAVVAGFQGIGPDKRIATLGPRRLRHQSAVALAAALKADRCDIYTDVDGVYTTDPRIEPKARKLDRASYEEMLEMASLGAKVLQVRSVELAMVHKVPHLCSVLPSSARRRHGPISGQPAGTLVAMRTESWNSRSSPASPIPDEAKVSLIARVADRPGVAAGIFGPLAEANINVDMIVQNISTDGKKTDMTFTVPSAATSIKALAVLEKHLKDIGYDAAPGRDGVSKVSVVGIGMRSHAGVAATAFKALAEKGINIQAITTSEIKISVLIDAAYTELAVRTCTALRSR